MKNIVSAISLQVNYPEGKGEIASEELGSWLIFILCLVVVLAIGAVDASTGWGFTTFALYGFPIFFASFRAGSARGTVLALISAAVWTYANFHSHHFGSTPAYMWAACSRLIVFLFVVLGAAALRNHAFSMVKYLASEARADELERHLLRIIEEERRWLGDDINKFLSPALRDLAALVETMREMPDERQAVHHKSLAESVATLRRFGVEISEGYADLRMTADEFSTRIYRLTRFWSNATGSKVTFHGEDLRRFLPTQSVYHLICICQEAVRNAARQGKARTVTISTRSQDDEVILRIEDDGDSFQLSPYICSTRIMALHAHQIHGDLTTQRLVPRGTEVLCKVRIQADQNASQHQTETGKTLHVSPHEPLVGSDS